MLNSYNSNFSTFINYKILFYLKMDNKTPSRIDIEFRTEINKDEYKIETENEKKINQN